MSHNNVVLLLGSNINNPEKNIQIALKKIEESIGAILNKSELINSAPVEFDSYNIFCNIAIRIKTQISPIKLLDKLKEIERAMGRTKDSSYFGTYQDRIMDIDLILYNDINFVSKRLIVPHYKNLFERDFAIRIINEVRLHT